MAFSYYSPLSINAAQVPSTQTDFPVLVSLTDARFKTVGNGGHVQNSSGFDIRPYTDSTLVTAITGYELERYNASTGEVIMWVKVSSLSSSTTPFVLAYGDSGISTDGSSTTTWSNNYLAVYHLKDGTTLSGASATGSNNLVNTGGATATAGKIDGGAAFVSASSQYMDTAGGVDAAAITASCWIKGTSFPGGYNCPFSRVHSSSYWLITIKSNGKLALFCLASGALSYDGTGSNTLSTGTDYYLTMVYSSSVGLIGYVNGASDGTAAANGALNIATSVALTLGRDAVNGRYWNGSVDQATLASVARSANWITTEYNNQSAPGTFETLGSEVAVGGVATGNFLIFMPH